MTKRILAVDDNPVMLDVYLQLLTQEGCQVTVAKDGSEALKVLEAGNPDLVLLDIEMPNISGWQFLEIMRGRVEWHDIPVIMVTGLIEPSDDSREALPEYNLYVTKKTTGKELLLLVEQALDGTLAAAGLPEPDTS